MHRQDIELVLHRVARARQKARTHPVGHIPESQIEARRLDLVVADRCGRDDLAAIPDCGAQ